MLAFITDVHHRIVAVGGTDEIFGLTPEEESFFVNTEDEITEYIVTTDEGTPISSYDTYEDAQYFTKNDPDDLWIVAVLD